MGLYFNILWRRKWVIVITTIVTVAIIAFSSYRADPVYNATSTLRVVPFGIGQPDYGTYLYFEQLTNTFSDILTSRTVTDEAKVQLSLENLPGYSIRVIPNSELLQITVTDADPELAQQTANVLTSILLERIRSQYNSNINSIEDSLGARVDELEEEINDLILEQSRLENEIPVDTVRIAEIERTIEVRQNTYNSLIVSYNQALVAQASQSNLISVIEPAYVPQSPSNRGLTFWIALGGVIGVVSGGVLAFLLESVQPRLYNAKQVENASNHAPLGHIPTIKKSQRTEVFENDLVAAETFRRLRTNLLAKLATGSQKSVIITSIRPNVTNVVISYNLATALAYAGHRVMLIDADMRQSSLHELISIPNDTGFSDLLREKATFDDAIHKTDIERLDVITAGPKALDSAELLNQRLVCDMLSELKELYDIILFIGPPIMLVTDSIVMAPMLGSAVVTLRNEALRKDLLEAVEAFEQVGANLLGVVVHDVRRSSLNIRRAY